VSTSKDEVVKASRFRWHHGTVLNRSCSFRQGYGSQDIQGTQGVNLPVYSSFTYTFLLTMSIYITIDTLVSACSEKQICCCCHLFPVAEIVCIGWSLGICMLTLPFRSRRTARDIAASCTGFLVNVERAMLLYVLVLVYIFIHWHECQSRGGAGPMALMLSRS
jgi:hypothetical protein